MMEKFQEMLHKLQLECEKARKRPIHRNKQLSEIAIWNKANEESRLHTKIYNEERANGKI